MTSLSGIIPSNITWSRGSATQTLFDRYTYTVRHGLIQGMRRKGGLGWLPPSVSSQSETKEHEFWKTLDLRGLVVYDIGCFHGILTLFFARQEVHK